MVLGERVGLSGNPERRPDGPLFGMSIGNLGSADEALVLCICDGAELSDGINVDAGEMSYADGIRNSKLRFPSEWLQTTIRMYPACAEWFHNGKIEPCGQDDTGGGSHLVGAARQ